MPRQYETFRKMFEAKLFSEVIENGKCYYYDSNKNLQFIYEPSKKRYRSPDGSKMYNNEFKRYIKNYAARIKDLEAFW